ncbi:MAG: aminotransferase class I/II-fold pyridoxal phosphate-dependent enzyme [Candidatus Eremiobacteraeota bacterium]|nr:aminotransferase class I/II-fold pyridoxal phosphate-dependent enzyme [Candidatus Eremiobacteraeota bacterium]
MAHCYISGRTNIFAASEERASKDRPDQVLLASLGHGDQFLQRLNQKKTPYFDALVDYVKDKTVSFHTPGHKQGVGMHRRLRDFIGDNVLSIDLTQVRGLDDLNQPDGPILDAQILAAQAYGADYSYFLINGSTAGNQAMLMTALRPGDTVLLPRNSHKSALSALIMSATRPVYMHPEVDPQLHVDHCVTLETVRESLDAHPEAKAVFITSPTYYGATADLARIVDEVHARAKLVLVDEAWGPHLHFHPGLPPSATSVKADVVVNSTHKLLGAMSQSSMLHTCGAGIDQGRLRSTLRIFQSTSPSLVLLASLDVARMQMATRGEALLRRTLALARRTRRRLNEIDGVYCMGPEQVGRPGIAGYDETRIVITVRGLGYTGYEAEQVLRERYNVQVELADLFNVVALVTIGDSQDSVGRLVNAVAGLAREDRPIGALTVGGPARRGAKSAAYAQPAMPQVVMTPRQAFLSEHVEVPFQTSAGRICAEVVTPYPPGIPILCPGELIDRESIDYLRLEIKAGVHIQGPVDTKLRSIRVLAEDADGT